MADKKISDLTSLSAADVAVTDIIPIVDVTAGLTKSITYEALFSAPSITTSLRIGGDSPIATFDNTGAIIGPPSNVQLSVKYTGGVTVASMQDTSWNAEGDIFLRSITDNNITAANFTTALPKITFPADGTTTHLQQIGFATQGKRRLTISNSGLTLTNGNFILDHVLDSPPNSPFEERRVGLGTSSPTEVLDVVGNIKATGTIQSTSYEAGDFPTTSTVRTTAGFKADGTMVQDERVIVVKVAGTRAQAMTTTASSYLELIPAPGANKVLVIRELEIFIDRGEWTPMSGGQLRGWGNNLQLVIETPANTVSGYGSTGKYNTFATFQKKFLNHTFNAGVFVAAGAVDTIIVRDAPATQTRAYPDKPLLLRPEGTNTYSNFATYSQTVDDDYYFRITYKIMDMTSDFTADTSIT